MLLPSLEKGLLHGRGTMASVVVRRGRAAISIYAYVNISLRDARGGGLRRERRRPLLGLCAVSGLEFDGARARHIPPIMTLGNQS